MRTLHGSTTAVLVARKLMGYAAFLIGWRGVFMGYAAFLIGWRGVLMGYATFLMGWRGVLMGYATFLIGWRGVFMGYAAFLIGWRGVLMGYATFLIGWRGVLMGYAAFLMGWREVLMGYAGVLVVHDPTFNVDPAFLSTGLTSPARPARPMLETRGLWNQPANPARRVGRETIAGDRIENRMVRTSAKPTELVRLSSANSPSRVEYDPCHPNTEVFPYTPNPCSSRSHPVDT